MAAPVEAQPRSGSQQLQPPAKPSFVEVLRSAAPYVQSHRNQTVVVCLPSEVMTDKALLSSVLADLVLLKNMSQRLCLCLGVQHQIDQLLAARGIQPRYVNGFRVTDGDVMLAAAEATGAARVEVEAALSKALSMPMLRRHHTSSREDKVRHGPSIEVVYGNWINGKRRGVIDGVDFGNTGHVRSLNKASISAQLKEGHIVLLTSLAYSLSGEVLNCNVYDIATHAAVELAADKLVVMSAEDLQATRGVPPWLPLNDAIHLLREDTESESLAIFEDQPASELPNSLLAAARACRHGVKRSHVIDAHVSGALLVELYSRDGLGVMVSSDFFEGIRPASLHDIDGIKRLYRSLRLDQGLVMKNVVEDDFNSPMLHVFVIEREAQVLGCAVMEFIGDSGDGLPVAELTAFCVHPAYRGSGRTDSLLDFVEQVARSSGIRRLVYLTSPCIATSSDWFIVHEFQDAGPAAEAGGLLPECRSERVDPAHASRLYVKAIYPPDAASTRSPAGKRIGI